MINNHGFLDFENAAKIWYLKIRITFQGYPYQSVSDSDSISGWKSDDFLQNFSVFLFGDSNVFLFGVFNVFLRFSDYFFLRGRVFSGHSGDSGF